MEEERKEGRREEVRSGGEETGIGSIDEEIGSSTINEGRDNQLVRDEVKGIWGLVRLELLAKGKIDSLNTT